MADEDGVNCDRPAVTGPSNQPATQPRPANTNDEYASASTHSRLPSKSPQQNSVPPPLESAAKPQLSESQDMTTTSSSSSSSQPPEQQVETAGPSPYGTRSRNRTGNSRINYAEDREPDLDYEWTSGKKSQGNLSSAVPSSLQSGDSDKTSAGNTRRSSTTAPNGLVSSSKATVQNIPNTNLPGMSTFSAYPDPNITPAPPAPTRKRKAPGSGPISSHSSVPTIQPPAVSVSKRTGASHASRLKITNLMTFEGCQGYLKNGRLKADDGTVLAVNDQVYLVCEPPGEPYYLARIMEFLHVDNDQNSPVDSLRVNWFLRSRDIGRKVNDTRAVFASMQSDTSPITSLRGKCKVLHRTDIIDLDAYRKEPHAFWYEKLYDRYIHRFYEVIPTSQVINVPAKVKKVLDERWKFVVLEVGRGRELTSAIKSCKRCQGYCASNDSVDCAVCKNTYHMNCVRPPLLKKPARGFGWSCGPCSRRQEKKLEARNTPIVGEKTVEGEEEEFVDEEEDQPAASAGNGISSNDVEAQSSGARPPTAEQVAQARLWPFRYLGIHCRVEDALDYDDRIYPRASSRLGPKHQATVQPWYGRHVEYVKPTDVKRRFLKANSHKRDAKLTKDTAAAQDANKIAKEKRPKWVMDEPPGFVARGEDFPNGDVKNTARLNFRLPQVGEISSRGGGPSNTLDSDQREKLIDDYMSRARALAPLCDLKEYSTNFLDKALELLLANNYHSDKALQQLRTVNKAKDLKEPELTKEELRRFEDGVKKFGSELRLVSKHVGKTRKHGEIVRFYYMWKKTPEGKRIWGNYEGRKGKKQQKQTDSKLVDDVADDIDDSAFDIGKAAARRRGFQCKFCAIRHSPQWRRAPATATGATVPIDPSLKSSKDKNAHLMLALCQRCAYLWRCYAIMWENPDEVAKKVASGGGRAWKRRIDEELLAELTTASVASSMVISTNAAAAAASLGVDVPSNLTIQPGQDGPKKRQRLGTDTPALVPPQHVTPIEPLKKKVIEKPPEPPLIPEQPKLKILPCAVCYEFVAGEELNDDYLCCNRCRLTVHRNCYGVANGRPKDKWTCDMCINDTAHHVSINYDCVLCSVREYPDKELFEAPKSHHKKKNEREKEKEKLERELVVAATENYYRTQREKGRPEQPRQPLKKTTNNNWVHVVCAIFHYEIKFADPKGLEPAEGIGAVPVTRFRLKCKLCRKTEGACVNCNHCQASIHVSCAQLHGYQLGFDINPVKGSRANAVNTVDMNGDRGTAAAVIYCTEHKKPPYNREDKKGIHSLAEIFADPDDPNFNLNALQAYSRSHKQADTSQTGTVRKALMLDAATNAATQLASAGGNHRGSVSSVASGAMGNSGLPSTAKGFRMSPGALTVKSDEVDQDGDRVVHLEHAIPNEPSSKQCLKCAATVSPKWHLEVSKDAVESKSAPAVENTNKNNSSSESAEALVNGHTNSENLNEREASAAPIVPSQPEVRTIINGDLGGDGAMDEDHTTDTTAPSFEPMTNGEGTTQEPAITDVINEHPKYYCNKCFQRRRREPTPPPIPTPPPDPVVPAAADEPVVEIQPEARMSNEPEPSPPPPPAPLAWPSQVAQASTLDPYQGRSTQTVTPSPSAPPIAPPSAPYIGPERLPNGVPRSPPVVAPPPPQHYAPPPPPPPPQNHHHPATYAPPPPQHYRDSRGVLHRGMPPQYHVPHLVNGVPAEPPSFQYRRDSSGNLYQVPYVPPAMRPQPAPAHRSPSMHDRSSQGPHGPPEAAENPFAVPAAPHSPPRPAFGSIYGSPSGSHERPETPPGAFVRDSRWSGEGSLINGASASPSLRNLLQ